MNKFVSLWGSMLCHKSLSQPHNVCLHNSHALYSPPSLPLSPYRAKKPPAGAVSLFGGVDLLGEITKTTNEEGGPKKVAPPTSKKSRGGGGLFGDIDAGEEDIFAFSGKKR